MSHQRLAGDQALELLGRHLQRPVLLEHHDKHLAEIAFRAVDLAHPVPGVAPAPEQQAAVVDGLRGILGVEILEGGGVLRLDAAAVVEHYRFAAPVRVPVIFRVQVENLRADLALGVAVGCDHAAIGGVVPVEAEAHGADSQQPAHEVAVHRSAHLVDQGLPGLGQLHAILVVQHVAVVGALAVFALLAEEGAEFADVGHGLQQFRVAFRHDEVLGVHPGVGVLPLEARGLDGVQHAGVQVADGRLRGHGDALAGV